MTTQTQKGTGARRPDPPPQPEQHEPEVQGTARLRDLSRRDLKAVVVRSAKELMKDQVPDRAAALAYYAFLSIPAVLLLALGIFGLVASPNDVTRLLDRADGVLPPEAITLLNDSLSNVAAGSGSGLTLLLIGIPVALWSATGAMNALMRALNIVYDREERRGFVKQRLTALAMLAWTFFAVLLVVGLLILGPVISRWIGSAVGAEGLVSVLWWTVQWPILVGGLLLSFAGILFLGPDVEHPRWRVLTVGAIVSTVLWVLISAGFAFYASNFGSYNATWGSLSVVVVTLTWLWLSGLAFLLGAEVDSELERSRELREGQPAEDAIVAPHKGEPSEARGRE
jgi:membrane protein